VYNQLDVPAIEALLQSPYLDGVARLVLGEGENGGGLFGSRFQGTAFDAHKAALRTRFGTRLRIYPTD
jgi:hypothetical protein